ncbi:efflux RND transporter permease subunit, partial [bacterium]|nr:efflux RND transporter permease subunit [bacterium]
GWAAIAYRLGALAIFAGLGFGAYFLYKNIDRDFSPRTPERQMDLTIETPRSFSLTEIAAVYDTIEAVVLAEKEKLEIAQVASSYRRNRGRMNIYFTPEEEAKKNTTKLYDEVKAVLPEIPGVLFKVGRMYGRGGRQMGVSVELKGKSTTVLATYAEQVKGLLEGIPGVKDVDTSMERGDEEVRVNVDRVRAQRYGLSSRQVASSVASALSSRANSRFKTQDREVNILVQLDEEDRVNMQQLENMAFLNSRDEMVQLGSVADFDVRKGPEAVQRQDRQTTISVFANTDRMGMWMVSQDISARMSSIKLPPGYSWSLGRNWFQMREMEEESRFAIYLAIILVYLVMASQFESLLQPFIIMFTIPFALTGVIITLLVTQTPISVVVLIGLIMLAGIVVNNAIVFIDYINQLRKRGMPKREAIKQAGQVRLRPILMTTLTTVLGLLPMALGLGEGAELRTPMALTVIGGLLIGTLLTLVVIPTVYDVVVKDKVKLS